MFHTKLKPQYWFGVYKKITPKIQGNWKCISTDAIECKYTIYESPELDTSKPPLLVFHAYLGSRSQWDGLAKAIHKTTGRRIVTMDARNHGESPHTMRHSYEYLVQDAVNLLNKLDITKVSVVGHSMGGLQAMVMSLLYPDMLSSLIVVDVSPIRTCLTLSFMYSILDCMTGMSFEPSMSITQAKELANENFKEVTMDDKLRDYLAENLIKTNKGTFTWKVNIPGLKANFADHIFKFPSNLKGLQYGGPTLFIGGSLSHHINKDDWPQILDYFPSAELNVIEGGKHWVQTEKPDKFVETISKFLNKH